MSATLDFTGRRRSAATEPMPTAPAGRRSPMFRRALRIASIALFVAAWQLAVHYRLSLGVVTFANVPSPADAIPVS